MDVCAICQATPVRPAALSCGHVLCGSCVRPDASRSMQCPYCRAAVQVAVPRIYTSVHEPPADLPKGDAQAVLAAILRAARSADIDAAVEHWCTFVVYTAARDPGFTNLAIAHTMGNAGIQSDLSCTADFISRFIPEDPEQPLARVRWLAKSAEAVGAYGVGVETWLMNGCAPMMLEALNFFPRFGVQAATKQ